MNILENELYHFGIKGMKWGVRRYEDKSGHLTPAGKKRYDNNVITLAKQKPSSRSKEEAMKRVSNKNAAKFSDRHRTGLRVTKAILRSALMDTVTANVSANLTASGMEGAAKALTTLESLGSWALLGRDLGNIYLDSKAAKRD